MQLACRPSDFQSLTGLRVLLAENEVVIALDLELMLQRLGCTVCQVTGSIDQTLQQLQEDRPDAVILNPRLHDGIALPVAEVLRQEQIPFVLIKDGLDDAASETAWKEAPRLRRPFGSSRLTEVLTAALASTTRHGSAEIHSSSHSPVQRSLARAVPAQKAALGQP